MSKNPTRKKASRDSLKSFEGKTKPSERRCLPPNRIKRVENLAEHPAPKKCGF
jgi:hypothetical protein